MTNPPTLTLGIYKGSYELARVHLNRAVLTVGRSPTCDVVLRAPGAHSIHFLIEWAGTGTFDASVQKWILSDVSRGHRNQQGEESFGYEGTLLDPNEIATFGGFKFKLSQDKLSDAVNVGGVIKQGMQEGAKPKKTTPTSQIVAELLHVRGTSGVIEEITHVLRQKKTKSQRVLAKTPQFQIEWNPQSSNSLLRVIASEMPGATIIRRGVVIQGSVADLQPDEILQIHWGLREFFVRLVPYIERPPVQIKRPDPLLYKAAAVVCSVAGLFLYLSFLNPSTPKLPTEPPRVARIEIKEEIAELAPSPATAKAAPPTVEQNAGAPKPENSVPEAKKSPEVGGTAAKNRFAAVKGADRPGLNAPAPAKDVNQLGVLGLFKNSGANSKAVNADTIINNGLVSETATSKDSRSNVLVRNPPGGVIGNESNAKVIPGESAGLSGASTTLRGGGSPDPNATGPIARKDGGSGDSIGASLLKEGKSLGGNVDIGSLDASDVSIAGGLDRETARRVIAGTRGELRACYDKALLSNPKLSGRILCKWVVSPQGLTQLIEVQKSTIPLESLKSCVMDVIKNMVFPAAANGAKTTIVYPFLFQARH